MPLTTEESAEIYKGEFFCGALSQGHTEANCPWLSCLVGQWISPYLVLRDTVSVFSFQLTPGLKTRSFLSL